MPTAFLYLGVLLVVVCVWFMAFKRPVYEAMLVSFLILVALTNRWDSVWAYVHSGLSTSLLYSMTAFVAMSIILTQTKIVDSCVAIILALLGSVRGGAGYVAVAASCFMCAFSGSGPGNVMATGALTIPAMIKSGFPRELAANIVSNSSYLGNMNPPSSNSVAALGALMAVYPALDLTIGQFWILMWGVSFWFILQRLAMVWLFCRRYHVEAVDKKDIPNLREVLKNGWQGLLLPVVILLPFVLDYAFKDTFFTSRLGAAGAKCMSSSLLLFIPGVVTFYAFLISKDKKVNHPHVIAEKFTENLKAIAPTVGVCAFGYMLGGLFGDLNIAGELEAFIVSMDFSKFGMVVSISLLTCFLGMVIPGSSLVVIFGPAFISAFVSVGVEPMLAAAMLPCICGVMCGITPPLGLGLYAGMAIAKSDYDKTFRNNLWWVAAQFLLEVVVLMGWLPIIGL